MWAAYVFAFVLAVHAWKHGRRREAILAGVSVGSLVVVKAMYTFSEGVLSLDPHFALLNDSINLDFMSEQAGPEVRGAVELSLESAKALQAALQRAISAAEREEAERHVTPEAA